MKPTKLIQDAYSALEIERRINKVFSLYKRKNKLYDIDIHRGYVLLERAVDRTRSWKVINWKVQNQIGKIEVGKLEPKLES